ncbi:hypothetical protein B0J11DRAFT_536488 [Dendryphion nanum]|uniref:Uncharacterized protein n=1 Tax=Dendryphion nanum TaxID=256645 RepID=A0A9P9DFA3_9PLEO|nr:hypothetical protein B0J11DRAFT_536488 [Dendryphion nanum]
MSLLASYRKLPPEIFSCILKRCIAPCTFASRLSIAAARLPIPTTRCRHIHLVKTAWSKTLLGQHKIVAYAPYKVPPLESSTHQLSLWTRPVVKLVWHSRDMALIPQRNELLQEQIDFQNIYSRIEPGIVLLPTQSLPKKETDSVEIIEKSGLQYRHNAYCLVPVGNKPNQVGKLKSGGIPLPKNAEYPVKSLKHGSVKEHHVTLSVPVSHFYKSLTTMYWQLLHAHIIEVTIRFSASSSEKNTMETAERTSWPWVHQHFPHLRPDVILASMPKDTYFMIDPWISNVRLKFAMAMPRGTEDKLETPVLNEELIAMRRAVVGNIAKGRQAGLPRKVREKLVKEGNENYLGWTALPRGAIEASNFDLEVEPLEFGTGSLHLPKSQQRILREKLKRTLKSPQEKYDEAIRRKLFHKNHIPVPEGFKARKKLEMWGDRDIGPLHNSLVEREVMKWPRKGTQADGKARVYSEYSNSTAIRRVRDTIKADGPFMSLGGGRFK